MAHNGLHAAAGAARDLGLAALRRIDDWLEPRRAPTRRRRIVYDATSPFELAMFKPIHERLRDDFRLDVFFTDSRRPHAAPRDVNATMHVLAKYLLPARRAWWMKFDVHVSAQYFRNRFVRSLRRVQIFHGVAGKAWNVSPRARQYDRLFLVSDYDRRRFVDSGLFPEDSPALELVGMPKTDCLVDGRLHREEILRSLGLPADRPSILYAPTWQTSSSLYTMGTALIEALAAGPWSVLVKLHDNCYSPDRAAGHDWAGELAPFAERPNVRVLRPSDISPLLVAADVLISDLSSVALEYLLLDRPVIVADAPALFERFGGDDVSHLQRTVGPLLRSPSETVALVSRALAIPGEYREARRAVAAMMFHDPGRATERAVAALYRLLGFE